MVRVSFLGFHFAHKHERSRPSPDNHLFQKTRGLAGSLRCHYRRLRRCYCKLLLMLLCQLHCYNRWLCFDRFYGLLVSLAAYSLDLGGAAHLMMLQFYACHSEYMVCCSHLLQFQFELDTNTEATTPLGHDRRGQLDQHHNWTQVTENVSGLPINRMS